ncbi:urease accessory protein UreF [Kribbella pratensis]|uniref:urease accessory protein UreF n=1 Tax=Kribbella pratensis TaxID=2512112 RepID=UPI001EE0D120|nr:urease accessory UreF family protein [Kribbella pratensis]
MARHVVLTTPKPASRADWSTPPSPNRETWSPNHNPNSRLDADGLEAAEPPGGRPGRLGRSDELGAPGGPVRLGGPHGLGAPGGPVRLGGPHGLGGLGGPVRLGGPHELGAPGGPVRLGGPDGLGATGAPGSPGGLGGLGVVERAWAGRTSSHVVRGVVRRQGRLLVRLAGRVWPGVMEYLPADGEIARPVALGVVAAVTGLSAEQLARVVAYDDAQTVVSASMKLLPVDPAEAATWLAALHDDIEELVAEVAPLTDVDKIPAYAAPLIDIHAQKHVTERMRLFHA